MSINELEDGITKAIKDTTIEVFSTMLMMEITNDESFVKDEKNVSTDLISSLHFFGDKYMGKIAVFSSGKVACDIANAMLGTEETMVNDEVKDGMGELVNMIAGGAKVKLMASLGNLHLLTPWVIAGRNLTIASSSDDGGHDDAAGLAIDSQAQFSWVMTKFTFADSEFLVGLQANEVPKDPHSVDIDVDGLIAENEMLKEKIKSLTAKPRKKCKIKAMV